LEKISIFENKFDFSQKNQFLTNKSIIGENFDF